MLFVSKGFQVYGIDRDIDKIHKLRQGKSYLSDVEDREIAALVNSGQFTCTDNFQTIKNVNTCIICVPTPLRDHRYPDLSYLQSAVHDLVPYMRPGQLFVLESTTFPGTTEEVLLPLLEQDQKFQVGKDFYLGYSPERIDPGNKTIKLENIPKVVSGMTEQCREKVIDLYGKVFQTLVPVSSPKVAEMTKILENCQRFVNISFINEMTMLCHKMNINIWDVIEAAKTKPYGFTAYYPGPGVGGHCIPVDPLYLLWKAKQFQFDTEFITLAKKVNDAMPDYVIQRLTQLLTKPLSEARVLVIGLTYKKDVNDLRESTALTIFETLAETVKHLDYHDQYLDRVQVGDQVYQSKPLDADRLNQYDCVLILTDHSKINYKLLVEKAPLIFDTRGVFKGSFTNVKPL
jgi:UDP-N-acetyl-D-glucosamine dehydrogenase